MPKAQDYHLSPEELKAIEKTIKHDRRLEVVQRCIAIRLLYFGYKPEQVAEMQAVSKPTIYGWFHRWQSGGVAALVNQPKSGRPPKLSDTHINSVVELLIQGAKAHGWQNDLWTAARVAEVIRKHLNINISSEQMRKILKNRLGWTVQRPVQMENKRDDTKIQHWKEHAFPQIVKDARAKGAYIIFIDEAGFMASPTRRQTYSPRGKTPVVKVTDPHGRISTVGAITVSPNNRNLNFICQLLPNNVNFRGITIVHFLKKICRRIHSPMTIIWDGISIHSSEPVKKFLEQHIEISVEPIPEYAHELNPVDKAWLYLKYDCLANYAPVTLDELRDRLTNELNTLPKKSKVLGWCIEKTGLKTHSV